MSRRFSLCWTDDVVLDTRSGARQDCGARALTMCMVCSGTFRGQDSLTFRVGCFCLPVRHGDEGSSEPRELEELAS